MDLIEDAGVRPEEEEADSGNILMNLFRGSGRLSGIRERSIIATETKKITIYRPLIQVFGDQIEKYVQDNALKYRNFIRKHIFVKHLSRIIRFFLN